VNVETKLVAYREYRTGQYQIGIQELTDLRRFSRVYQIGRLQLKFVKNRLEIVAGNYGQPGGLLQVGNYHLGNGVFQVVEMVPRRSIYKWYYRYRRAFIILGARRDNGGHQGQYGKYEYYATHNISLSVIKFISPDM